MDKLSAAVARVEALLLERQKITSAITSATTEMPEVISARTDAESRLGRLEASLALGEPGADSKAVGAARRNLTSCREALDGLTGRLRGLKSRAEAQAAELIAAHAELRDLLPAHRKAAQDEFEPVWLAAIDEFSRVLKKRRALETALGARFDLPDATPDRCNEPADAGDLGKPGNLLSVIEQSIQAINAGRQHERRANLRKKTYDPNTAYTLKRAWGDFPAGSIVTGAVLGTDGPWLHSIQLLTEAPAS